MKKLAFTFAALTFVSVAFASSALAGPRSSNTGHANYSSNSSHGGSNSYRAPQYSTYRSRSSNYSNQSGYGNYRPNYGTRFTYGYSFPPGEHTLAFSAAGVIAGGAFQHQPQRPGQILARRQWRQCRRPDRWAARRQRPPGP